MKKGMGPGRGPKAVWREQGYSEEEVEALNRARIEKIKAVKARAYALRMEKKALTMGLGEAAVAAHAMDKVTKEIGKAFRSSPLKGVRRQSVVEREIAERSERERRKAERATNPRIKGLQNVPGLKLDPDGTIGWQELRKQMPGIEDMRKAPVPGVPAFREKINAAIRARGGKDRMYD